MMVVVGASGEVSRLAAAPPVASSSDGLSGAVAAAACRHGGGRGSGCPTNAVSLKKEQQITPSIGSTKCRLVGVETGCGSSCTSTTTVSYGGGAGGGFCGPGRQRTTISTSLERIQGSTAMICITAAGREKRRGAVQPPRAVQTNVTTVVPESWIGSDESVEKALAIARTAAMAARDAARDAAAYAEAQALADDSSRVFPSEQDLLLLERARLTEMARSGAVQVVSPETETEHCAPNQWKDWEFRPRGVDEQLGATSTSGNSSSSSSSSSTLEVGVLERPRENELGENRAGGDGVIESLRDGVTVRSNRRRERMLKRERASLKADTAAAAVPPPSTAKPRKPQMAHDASDPVRSFLRDVGKTKLLTSAEEAGLAEGIQDLLRMESVKADLMEQMGREPTVLEWARAVGTEHHSLESRIKTGQFCKDKMVNSNLRLVVSIAKRYQGRGMAIQDLIQEGSMGLIRGAEKFDHTRGFKFSTYAHWWIRQAITRAIADQSRTIRLPVHVYELLSRITKAKSMLAAEHGRVPRDEEVAELVGLNIEKLKLVIKSARTPKSMEFPVGKNNDTMLGEVIPDKDVESPEEAISKRLLKQDLDIVLNTLNPRERDVLKLRYGLEDGRMRTLEEIGNVFSVTRERIRQIESKALRKLRQPSRNTSLREYLDLKT